MRRPSLSKRGTSETSRWIAIEQWLFRQPFDLTVTTLPGEGEQRIGVEVFLRILPFFARTPIEEVLDKLHFSWRKFRLARYAHGVTRGIDTVLATARAQGQDETAFLRLVEWGKTHPMAARR